MQTYLRAPIRYWLRILLLALALPQGAVSFWALLASRTFYDLFPAPGLAWVASHGPFNEHLIVDYGASSLALVVVSLMAVPRPERRATTAVALGWIAWTLPHLAFHVANAGALAPPDSALNIAVVAINAALSVALLAAARALPDEAGFIDDGLQSSGSDAMPSRQGRSR